MRTSLALLAALLVLGACGDDTLTGLGAASDWVAEAETEREAVLPSALPAGGSGFISSITWYNGWTENLETDPATLVAEVWAETDGSDEFVQAAPNEIAIAVPGIKIPADLSADVEHVTSQIVYNTASGTLGTDFVAAFGFWTSEPYLNSREVSQVASLQMAYDSNNTIDEADPTLGCARFLDRNVSNCQPSELLAPLGWWVTNLDGTTLVWIEDGFRYELLKRNKLSIEDAEIMATTLVPLIGIAPSEATLAITSDPRG